MHFPVYVVGEWEDHRNPFSLSSYILQQRASQHASSSDQLPLKERIAFAPVVAESAIDLLLDPQTFLSTSKSSQHLQLEFHVALECLTFHQPAVSNSRRQSNSASQPSECSLHQVCRSYFKMPLLTHNWHEHACRVRLQGSSSGLSHFIQMNHIRLIISLVLCNGCDPKNLIIVDVRTLYAIEKEQGRGGMVRMPI
jgi:hypothetical protein